MDIHALVDEAFAIDQAIEVSQKRLYEVRKAISDYMQAESASRIPHVALDVCLRPGRKKYDVDKVRAVLGEVLPPHDLDKLILHGGLCTDCNGTGQKPDAVSGTQANVIRRYGDEYAHLLEKCVVAQADPVLSITPKVKKGAAA